MFFAERLSAVIKAGKPRHEANQSPWMVDLSKDSKQCYCTPIPPHRAVKPSPTWFLEPILPEARTSSSHGPLAQPIGDATLQTIMSSSPLISRPRRCDSLVAPAEGKLHYQDGTVDSTCSGELSSV